MKTDDLVLALSRDDPRPKGFAPAVTVAVAAILSVAVVMTVSIACQSPRADLMTALRGDNHIILVKLAFTIGVVVGALPIVRALSVPGRRLGWLWILAVVPFLAIAILAAWELGFTPIREWSRQVDDAAWLECMWQIPALALPAFVILTFGVRRLAPTNLVRTGAYIGLVAGGVGGIGYVLHCHEDSLAFVAVAYTLAIIEMAVLGALAGPWALRWK